MNSKGTDPVEAIKGFTGGFGVDVAIDAVGHPKVFEQAFYARDLAGRVVMVGVPTPDMEITLPAIEVFGRVAGSSPPGTATACPAATSRC